MAVLDSTVEEYHPRWGARTSNPVKFVNDRLGGFDSCLFRRFNLPIEILTNDKLESACTGNRFMETILAIARLDTLSRNLVRKLALKCFLSR